MHAFELSRILQREVIIDRTAAKIFALFTFISLGALGAYVRIPLPFTPVPITLQTFFVLLAGAVLGKNWGAASQFSYVVLGCMGLSIFTGAASGLTALLGPTGGYLLGFILATWTIGMMISRYQAPRFSQILIIMLLGSLLIDILGCLWLKVIFNLSGKNMLMLGLWPFLPGDILKSIGAAVIYHRIRARTRQIFS